MNFLPDDYESPSTSDKYLKLQNGETKFRILSQPILGWEEWINDKPVRYQMSDKPQASNDPNKPIRHFWSFIVWNYNQNKIQIMHLTQASIRKKIEALCNDPEWGSPYFYDLKVIKTGEKMKTKYDVNPVPHRDVSPEIINEFNDNRCCLDAIFANEDPFSLHGKATPGVFKKSDLPSKPAVAVQGPSSVCTPKEIQDLKVILADCDPVYITQLERTLGDMGATIDRLPTNIYVRVTTAAIANRESYKRELETVPF